MHYAINAGWVGGHFFVFLLYETWCAVCGFLLGRGKTYTRTGLGLASAHRVQAFSGLTRQIRNFSDTYTSTWVAISRLGLGFRQTVASAFLP